MDEGPSRGLLVRLVSLLKGQRSSTPEELEKEIQGLVDQGEAEGLISPREGEMIEAVMDLDQTTAAQIMVPRIALSCVGADSPVEEIIKVIVETGHSRIPVYEGDLDHIVGVIHAKDLLPFWNDPGQAVDLKAIARDPYFVPQAMMVDAPLAAFKRRRLHLAVVVDEYGGTAGIVTMEDILEEIVGEIQDEYDNEAEPLLREEADGSLVVDGGLEVEKLAERLGVELPRELPEGRFETVGGLVTTFLGRVPKVQEKVSIPPGVEMVVLQADERRVDRLKVSLAEAPLAPTAN